ncbi:MAG TPA: 3-hydroxyacyl-CoA dehydrogenase family protein [Thermomicrobiales bacterium]|nr:3-hydroxyacyl-CoA dehydrogenase family protein [Thermomicrobiales bacterium]
MSDESSRAIERVAVIGAGTMGAQIASLAAISGRTVALFDALPAAAQRGRDRAEREILPAIDAAGMMDGSAADAIGRLRLADSLADAVADADLVIEAVREDLDTKLGVFAELSRLAPRQAILATNSSSLPSVPLAAVVEGPQRLLNMHFFAPVWVRSMLELMTCGETSEDVLATAKRFGRSLGLVTAVVRGQSKGFIINRIWRAVKRESLRVVDEGVADPEDVDRLWMLFFQTKYAPFGIMDMVGLDVVADIEASYHAVSLDPTDRPSKTLHRMIAEGNLGEKSGRGFYSHPDPDYLKPGFLLGKDDE